MKKKEETVNMCKKYPLKSLVNRKLRESLVNRTITKSLVERTMKGSQDKRTMKESVVNRTIKESLVSRKIKESYIAIITTLMHLILKLNNFDGKNYLKIKCYIMDTVFATIIHKHIYGSFYRNHYAHLWTGHTAGSFRIRLVTTTKYKNVCRGVHATTRRLTFSDQFSAELVVFPRCEFFYLNNKIQCSRRKPK